MKYPNIDQSPTRATRTLHKKLQVFLPKRRVLLEKYLTENEMKQQRLHSKMKHTFYGVQPKRHFPRTPRTSDTTCSLPTQAVPHYYATGFGH